MSSVLAVSLGRHSRFKLGIFSYGVTDESFAVNLARLQTDNWDLNRSLVVNHSANLVWIISTVIGGLGGQYIPTGAFGIDYALIAMFICLLIYQLKDWITIIVAVISGGMAVIFALLIPGNSYIVLAAVIAAGLGVVIQRKYPSIFNGENNAFDKR
jgi:predicted branched-subunit amino acid permease